MYAVVDMANEPERVAWLRESEPDTFLVNVPLVRRSEQPVPSFPYGFAAPLWTGHERFGNHAVAYLANKKTWRSLCGRAFYQSTFDEEINESRCDACVKVAQPITIRRLYAQRRGGEILHAAR